MADHLHFEHLYIGGSARQGESGPLDVDDPADESVFATAPAASLGQFGQAVEAARQAFDKGPWPSLPASRRVETLARMAGWLASRREELVETAVRETGSTLQLARWAQVDMSIEQAHQLPELFAGLPEWEHNELPLDTYLGPDGRDVTLSIRRYEPCGVVAAITPYNFPLQTNVWKVFSALATGCTVVLRPSPLCPLTALALGEAAAEAGLPPGVLNVVVESGSSGAEMLTSDPRVDCVSFTGSTAVGRRIAAQAARTVKRVLLELGGKSVQLSETQRTHIKDIVVKDRNVARAENVNFSIDVGVAVPRTVHVAVLPADIVDVVPEYRGFDYVVVGDQLLIIDPNTMLIVEVLPV